MASLTRPRNTVLRQSHIAEYHCVPMGAHEVLYIGCMACIDSNGYAVDAADASGYKYGGIVVQSPQRPGLAQDGRYDNSEGEDGEMMCWLRRPVIARLTLALRTPTQDMLGARVYVYSNNEVAVHKFDVAHDVECGFIIRLPGMAPIASGLAQMGADEVEVATSGYPFDWDGGVTTTTTAARPTTTTTGAL